MLAISSSVLIMQLSAVTTGQITHVLQQVTTQAQRCKSVRQLSFQTRLEPATLKIFIAFIFLVSCETHTNILMYF